MTIFKTDEKNLENFLNGKKRRVALKFRSFESEREEFSLVCNFEKRKFFCLNMKSTQNKRLEVKTKVLRFSQRIRFKRKNFIKNKKGYQANRDFFLF